jgi:membrane-bound metal-dependent hydrolase YbcI (DUF457 family)
MRGHTHALFGLTTLALIQAYTGFIDPTPSGLALGAGAAIFGALAPDIDAEESTIKHELGLVGSVASAGLRLFGVQHRGLTHRGLTTIGVMGLAWGLAGHLGYAEVGLTFGLGYLSHVLTDALTKRGVPLGWPLPGQFHLLPGPLRIRTGGPAEALLFLGGAMVLIWLAGDIIASLKWQV